MKDIYNVCVLLLSVESPYQLHKFAIFANKKLATISKLVAFNIGIVLRTKCSPKCPPPRGGWCQRRATT